jgi:DNA phosphorothioation-associated putative methyltransferase
MLVYMALARFGKRPALSQLPCGLWADIRAFFRTYVKACRQADDLLLQAGDASAIDEACRGSPIGKLFPDDLYVHKSAVDALGPLLRVYERCGRTYLGEVEGANLIKIHRRSGKISYLGGGSNRFAPPSPRSPARWYTTSAENGMSEFDARVNS